MMMYRECVCAAHLRLCLHLLLLLLPSLQGGDKQDPSGRKVKAKGARCAGSKSTSEVMAPIEVEGLCGGIGSNDDVP